MTSNTSANHVPLYYNYIIIFISEVVKQYRVENIRKLELELLAVLYTTKTLLITFIII